MRTGSARPVVVDLFAGAGGLSLGLEQAGFDVLAAVEYDPIHALTHRYNFPHCTVLCRDVRALAGRDLIKAAESGARALGSSLREEGIDVIAGGPSCQGFSSGGQRDPDDDRNTLLSEFVRLVIDVRPRAFVLENVSGLLEPRFEEFRNTHWKLFRSAGYSLSGTDRWVDANEFGVPQTRKRVVVIGVLDGPPVSIEAKDHLPVLAVRDAFEGLPVIELYDQLLIRDSATLKQSDIIRRARARSRYSRNLAGVDDAGDRSYSRDWDETLVTNSLRTMHSHETKRRFERTAPGTTDPVSRLFRLSLDLPSRTLRAGTGSERGAHTAPRPIHPTIPRVITVREAARLHGYPDWFRFAATNWHGHRQVGNSVPPPLAFAAGNAVMSALGERPRRPSAIRPTGELSWLTMKPLEAADVVGAISNELPGGRTRKDSKG